MTMKMTHENVARALLNASLDNFMDSDGNCKCCVDATVAQKAFEMLNPVRPKDLDYDARGHNTFVGTAISKSGGKITTVRTAEGRLLGMDDLREKVINELVEHIESALSVDSDYVD